MPTEIRQIMFSLSESIEAVSLYRRARGEVVPRGRIKEARAIPARDGAAVTFRLLVIPDSSPNQGSDEVKLGLEGPALAAALASYCARSGIPVSTGANRALQVFGERLGLVVSARPAAAQATSDMARAAQRVAGHS